MGCNAWNHSADCNCGWGGVWHGNTSISQNSRNGQAKPLLYVLTGKESNRDCFVNPNANCPVCGASVFFYQSPNGGRVFFDELGPPWPKHPCTDNPNVSDRQLLRDTSRKLKGKQPIWERDGWEPFTGKTRKVENKFRLFGHHTEIRAKKRKRRIHAILIPDDENVPSMKPIRYIYYRDIPPARGVLELSLLVNEEPVQCIGYLNLISERELELMKNAIAGDSEAFFELAAHYANLKMFTESYYWLNKLIDQGDETAKRMLKKVKEFESKLASKGRKK